MDEELDAIYLAYAGMEASLSAVRVYAERVVPGLLQTPEYAETVTASAAPEEQSVLRQAIDKRLERQVVQAARMPKMRSLYILDEAVLRRSPGSLPVLRRQLEHLTDCAKRPETEIRVLPFRAGIQSVNDTICIFTREDGTTGVYCDAGGLDPVSPFFITDPHRIARMETRFEATAEAALSPEDSVAFIEAAARAL
jgi:Domain of unknown function (DUF5753)